MSDRTHLNLKDDVEDKAVSFGLSPNLEAHFAREPLELGESGCSYFRLAPNFRIPFGHRHKQQEELYVVIRGSGRVKIGDDVLELRELDAIRVPGSEWRCFEGGPDGIEYVAFGAPQVEDPATEAEQNPGWWTD